MEWKSVLLKIAFLPGLFAAFFSCKQVDPCKSRDCGQYGTCIAVGEEGECQCEDGFEKNSNGLCEVFKISQYAGSYTALDTCINQFTQQESFGEYPLEIQVISPSEIQLNNLGSFNCKTDPLKVSATVDGNEFQLQSRKYCIDIGAGTEYEISGGKGSISSQGIRYSYSLSFIQSGTVTLSQSCAGILVKN